MSRKKQSFGQLIDYFNKETPRTNELFNNFKVLDENITKEEIEREFLNNSQYLKNSRWANYLYHEILSLPSNKLSKDEQSKILLDILDIWDKYISKRANNCLVYGKVHIDTEHTHLHLLISANERFSTKRLRISKERYKAIQQEIDNYIEQNYPELGDKKLYHQESRDDKKQRKEQDLEARTKEPSKKEILRDKLITVLRKSKNREELETNLKEINLIFYERGQTMGVEDITTKKRHRFKTLNLLDNYLEYETRVKEIEERGKELENYREETKQWVKHLEEQNQSIVQGLDRERVREDLELSNSFNTIKDDELDEYSWESLEDLDIDEPLTQSDEKSYNIKFRKVKKLKGKSRRVKKSKSL